MCKNTACLLFCLSFFGLIFVFVPVDVPAQNSSQLTISTYYPSPYGVYKRLKRIPSAETDIPACTSEIAGDMFLNQDQNQVVICKEKEPSVWEWDVMGAISETEKYNAEDFCITDEYGEELCLSDMQKFSDSQMLVNGAHTVGDCKRAGGEVVDTDVGLPQCRFQGSSCPSGWKRYKSYDTTVPHTCGRAARWCLCSQKTTGYHAWSDGMFACNNYSGWVDYYHVEWVWYREGNDATECCSGSLLTDLCFATIVEIGCY